VQLRVRTSTVDPPGALDFGRIRRRSNARNATPVSLVRLQGCRVVSAKFGSRTLRPAVT